MGYGNAITLALGNVARLAFKGSLAAGTGFCFMLLHKCRVREKAPFE
jgi:hypothetical protein